MKNYNKFFNTNICFLDTQLFVKKTIPTANGVAITIVIALLRINNAKNGINILKMQMLIKGCLNPTLIAILNANQAKNCL